jgi:REP element-mobilizing transposase RayT
MLTTTEIIDDGYQRERSQRLFLPNTFYHAYNRGNRKEPIFLDEQDYIKFLQLIFRAEKNTSVLIYGYCLMPNHYHLLLRLGSDTNDLSRFFQRSMTSYSLYFNYKYKLVGHLFQERYQYRILLTKGDIEIVQEYMKNNPTEANLVKNSTDYKWLWIYDIKTMGDRMPGMVSYSL